MCHNSVSNWFHERWICTGIYTGPNLGVPARAGEGRLSKIYSEKINGAKCDRPELQRLLKALEPGSVVVVTRLDRLGGRRSTC